MSKHTPGPWRVDGDGRAAIVRGADGVIVSIRHRAPIETHVANARLIAAAPELLAALEQLEPFLDAIVCFASTMDEHKPNRLAHNARAAIAKANGETP